MVWLRLLGRGECSLVFWAVDLTVISGAALAYIWQTLEGLFS